MNKCDPPKWSKNYAIEDMKWRYKRRHLQHIKLIYSHLQVISNVFSTTPGPLKAGARLPSGTLERRPSKGSYEKTELKKA